MKIFNTTYYKTCFYNPFFSMLLSTGRSIEPYVLNEFYYYDTDPRCGGINLIVKCDTEKCVYEILNSEGINVEFPKSENIIADVINAVDNSCPAMLILDHFYLPFSATFQKGHAPHYLLIYGYDKQESVFYAIDNQSHIGCYKTKIDFGVLINSYYSCINNCHIENGNFQVFSIEQSSKVKKGIYYSIPVINKEKKLSGIDKLWEYIGRFEEFSASSFEFNKAINDIPDLGYMFFYIRAYKNAESYGNSFIYSKAQELVADFNSIIKKWGAIRVIFEKYLYTKTYQKTYSV